MKTIHIWINTLTNYSKKLSVLPLWESAVCRIYHSVKENPEVHRGFYIDTKIWSSGYPEQTELTVMLNSLGFGKQRIPFNKLWQQRCYLSYVYLWTWSKIYIISSNGQHSLPNMSGKRLTTLSNITCFFYYEKQIMQVNIQSIIKVHNISHISVKKTLP